jgi:II/X family phage/plasmid replication protein
MLDTVKLASPYLVEDVALRIEGQLKLRQAVDLPTGVVDYTFISGQLDGSYDHRISLQVSRERWVNTLVKRERGGSYKVTELVPCPPFLQAEGSVHKAMLGHNVSGGPCDVRAALRWFVGFIADAVGQPLPDARYWQVRRLDWAEAFDLGSFAAVEEYIRGLSGAAYPKRKPVRHGSASIMFPGGTTTVKAYHKGPEFAKHDHARLQRSTLAPQGLARCLQEAANSVLRLEVGIKARKLDADHAGIPPLVGQISEMYCTDLYTRETARMLREGQQDMETVRTYDAVQARLFSLYSRRLATGLMGTWVGLSTVGEEQLKRTLGHDTFYRHRRQLAAVSVSWHGTDVALVNRFTHIPADFSPTLRDPRRLTGEDPTILRLLAPYREPMAAD